MRDLVKSLLFFALILWGTDANAHDNYCHRWHICPSDTGSYVCGDMGMCDQCPDNQYCQDKKPRKGAVSQEKKKFRSSIRDLEPPSLSKKKSNEPDKPSQPSATANVNSDKTEKPLTLEDLTVERIPALTKSPKIKVSSKPATKPRTFNAKELFKETHESVVLIMSFDSNNQPLAIGSGFYVDDGRTIVTNLHVISGAQTVRIKNPDGKVFRARIVLGVDSTHDLVILEADVYGKPIPLSRRTPEIGEDIIAIGNPKGLEATLSKGIVSGVRNDQGSIYYQVTAPISPGSSGGPIIDGNGEVIGVSTFYVQGGQNLNFAMPSAYIHRLLKSWKDFKRKNLIQTQGNK